MQEAVLLVGWICDGGGTSDQRQAPSVAGPQVLHLILFPLVSRLFVSRSWNIAAWWPPMLIIAVTFIAYAPALNGAFLWDDSAWTDDIERFTRDAAGLWQLWSDPTALQQYYPLTGTTFWLDRQLWGAWTLPYHVENVLLHALAAILLWRVLLRLGLRLAAPAALLFAVHPVMAESVAWIAERKNVLSMVLMLAAALCWLREARVASFGFFLAAMLAKATAFVLPPALLLIAWWKNGDLRWRRDVRPLLPQFITALVLCMIVMWIETHLVKAEGLDFQASFAQRSFVAGHVPWFYLGKLLWPLDLCSIYPVKWQSRIPPVLLVIALPALIALHRRLGRGPVAGALFFMAALLPVLGYFNVYGMLFSPVSDRWAYTASLAFFAGLASLPMRAQPVLLALMPVMIFLTRERAQVHEHQLTYWQAVLDKNPSCWIALHGLGLAQARGGDVKAAIPNLRRALERRPQYAKGWANLGNARMGSGENQEALACFERAIKIEPALKGNHYNLGNCYLALGKADKAIAAYEKEIEWGGVVDSHNNLGAILLQSGRVEEAMKHFQAAVTKGPQNVAGYANLGLAQNMAGQPAAAVKSYENALRLQPDHPGALSNLAWLLATSSDAAVRDGQRAVSLASRGREDAQTLRALAAAYAETGQFEQARTTVAKALAQAAATPLEAALKEDLKSYQQNQPFRQK